jgi:tRNA nucleotidyltransferase (CCA-adding enzyme)
MEFEEAVAAAREQVDPTPEERTALSAAAERLRERARAAVTDLPVEADLRQVGSTARGTWVRGDRDIDLFVRFPTDLDRARLEEYGLQVGRAVLPEGREEYAEHPYITGEFEGFEVDLVPCYRVESAAQIESAVDRTPFHTEYLEEHLDREAAADARLLKRFLKGVGAYGSDLRTRGFSGYLVELLVLHYGGFRAVLETAAEWDPPVHIDPEDHGDRQFDDPLVVIDPTDPERNVAAVCSAENVARLQHHARAFLETPTVERFFPTPPEPLSPKGVKEHVARRGTTPLAVRFEAPDAVDDDLYPQLRRSLSGLRRALDERGFDVLRAAAFAESEGGERSAALFLELAVARRPAVERHEGPPVATDDHAERFYGRYADGDAYGPFIDGERYVVERDRGVTTAREFAERDLLDVALGAGVERSLREGYDVLVGDAVAELAEPFGAELARYFDPIP